MPAFGASSTTSKLSMRPSYCIFPYAPIASLKTSSPRSSRPCTGAPQLIKSIRSAIRSSFRRGPTRRRTCPADSPKPDPAGARAAPRLLDGERALHAAGLVTGDRAEERVGAGLEADRELRGAARADDRPLALDGSPDPDVVLDRRLVRHLDRDVAGFRGGLAGHERERAARVCGDREQTVLLE